MASAVAADLMEFAVVLVSLGDVQQALLLLARALALFRRTVVLLLRTVVLLQLLLAYHVVVRST